VPIREMSGTSSPNAHPRALFVRSALKPPWSARASQKRGSRVRAAHAPPSDEEAATAGVPRSRPSPESRSALRVSEAIGAGPFRHRSGPPSGFCHTPEFLPNRGSARRATRSKRCYCSLLSVSGGSPSSRTL
jgi:hypothetical protein